MLACSSNIDINCGATKIKLVYKGDKNIDKLIYKSIYITQN